MPGKLALGVSKKIYTIQTIGPAASWDQNNVYKIFKWYLKYLK